MPKASYWSENELKLLHNNYILSTIEEMEELLPNRTRAAIQWKASSLGLIIRNGKQIKASNKIVVNITDEQLAFLQNKRNHSRIIRTALNLFIENDRQRN